MRDTGDLEAITDGFSAVGTRRAIGERSRRAVRDIRVKRAQEMMDYQSGKFGGCHGKPGFTKTFSTRRQKGTKSPPFEGRRRRAATARRRDRKPREGMALSSRCRAVACGLLRRPAVDGAW